jgi:hypothetical protein
MSQTKSPCIYDRENRWVSIKLLKSLAANTACSHVAIAKPHGSSQMLSEVLVIVASPCFKQPNENIPAHCGRSFEAKLWVACFPNEAAARRLPSWETQPIVVRLRSLHPDRLLFKTDVGELSQEITLKRLAGLPLLESIGIPRNDLVDDRAQHFQFTPGEDRQFASIDLEGDIWPNHEQTGRSRKVKAFVAVTVPSIKECEMALLSNGNAGKEDRFLKTLVPLNVLCLNDYRVVDGYYRFDSVVRSRLCALRDRIIAPLVKKSTERENYLIAAAPGIGKSHLPNQIAFELRESIEYIVINVSSITKDALHKATQQCSNSTRPVLCTLDEIDARPAESWLYDSMFSCLDLNKLEKHQIVFVLLGSAPGGLPGLIASMSSRHKGRDLVSRIPVDNHFELSIPGFEDQFVIVASSAREQMKTRLSIESIEKMVFYYVVKNDLSPRQIDELIRTAVQRMAPTERVLRYSHLFDPANRRNQNFWAQNASAANDLSVTAVGIRD